MKKILIILTLCFLYSINVSGQINKYGIPFIKNYTLKDYHAGTQNWSIAQDTRGVMYFGNKMGILEYDGTNWRLINVLNNNVRSLAVDNVGVVYVGVKGNFGYLAPDSVGQLYYKSLSQKLDSADRNFSNVWEIIAKDNSVYFRTTSALYRYTSLEDSSSFKVWHPVKSEFRELFLVDNDIYIRNRKVGVMKLVGDSLALLAGFKKTNDSIYVKTMLPYSSNQILTGTSKNISIIDIPTGDNDYKIRKFNTGIDDFLDGNRMYYSTSLSDGNFAFSTRTGNFVMNTDGELINYFNKQTSLQDESVKYAFCNFKDNNSAPLWLALNNGIAKVEINSAFRHWGEFAGLKGTVYDIVQHGNFLYVATNLGVFLSENSETNSPTFKKVEHISGSAWSLLSIKSLPKHLLVGTQDGIYSIQGSEATLIQETKDVFKLYSQANNDNIIFVGQNDGLALLQWVNNKWNYSKSQEIKSKIRNIAQDKKGNIWLGASSSTKNEIIKISNIRNIANTQFSKLLIKHYDSKYGLPDSMTIRIKKFGNDLVFLTPKGLYEYDYTDNIFVTGKSRISKFVGNKYVFLFEEDTQGNYWMRSSDRNKKDKTEIIIKQGETFYKDSIPFKRLPEMSVQVIYPHTDGITWIGGSEGLFSYDAKRKINYDQAFNTLIRKVAVDEDSVIFYGTFTKQKSETEYTATDKLEIVFSQPESSIPELEYKNNSISFYYSAPYFIGESGKMLYSHYLEGVDKKWTKWTTENKAIYTNLFEGEYIFKVKAKNTFGTIGNIASYTIVINPPWYRTILAYIVYAILIGLFIYGLIKLNTRRLVKEKEKLEEIVLERTAEILEKNAILGQQKEEIQAQTEHVEEQNKELEKQRDYANNQRDMIADQQRSIMDSIHYASRIQIAVLPPENLMDKLMPTYFVLYKPRDVVSGDFYWITQRGNKLIITAADCTGHGVPGAFMSMLGIAFLNEIVNKAEQVDGVRITASGILDQLRAHIIQSLRQTGKDGEAKDGMDIALCVLDLDTLQLQYSGAYNPLYLVRKQPDVLEFDPENYPGLKIEHSNGYEMLQFKPDKMPIGIHFRKQNNFTNTEFQLKPEDTIYLFSDGYVDQIGGERGRKYMSRKFRKMILDIQEKSMEDQRIVLDDTMENWKSCINKEGKEYEQVDDILVLGLKV